MHVWQCRAKLLMLLRISQRHGRALTGCCCCKSRPYKLILPELYQQDAVIADQLLILSSGIPFSRIPV